MRLGPSSSAGSVGVVVSVVPPLSWLRQTLRETLAPPPLSAVPPRGVVRAPDIGLPWPLTLFGEERLGMNDLTCGSHGLKKIKIKENGWLAGPCGTKRNGHRRRRGCVGFGTARIAPNCATTAIARAEALAANHRFSDAQAELFRVFNPGTSHADPVDHHVGRDEVGGYNAKARKRDALGKAGAVLLEVTVIINNMVVPREAGKLLDGDAAVDQVRARAKRLAESYPYSVRARLLRVYTELEGVRALDLAADRRRLLRRALAQTSEAAGHFDDSIPIALFHAKVLFALDEFDGSEREYRRALCIQTPTDPNLEDIPPAVSVPGADCDARVSSVKKQLRVLLKQIVVAAAVCWSIKSMQHRDMVRSGRVDRVLSGRIDRVLSVRVDTLQEHYDRIDKSTAKTISDSLRYRKQQGSWSFLVCPNPRCDGKKFVDTQSLWQHMSSKHRDELWEKLQSILGPDLYEDTPKHDHLLDGITLSQDSDQHDIFHLPRVQDIFESLLLSPSIGVMDVTTADTMGVALHRCGTRDA
ncbi:hypothetical protein ACQ4PT_016170 [Festuca glaucescens]